jgi:predicted dehydrogenase
MMSNTRIRIGFIGLNPDSHWAATAHIPALGYLSDKFQVVGVANSTPESGQKTAEALGIKHAFATPQDLVTSDEVDLVVVTVKVPYHYELITAALNAGKHVHSEWPLGNGTEEARKLTELAKEKNVVATCSTQMRAAPEILYLQQLIKDGFVGEVLSTSLIGSGGNWGAECIEEHTYLYDKSKGATMLEIPFAHTLAGIKDVLGDFADVTGKLVRRRNTVKVSETGKEIERSDFDQIMVHGTMKSGAAFAAHYRGGMSKGTNLLWEINGTEGDLQIIGDIGHGQFAKMIIKGAKAGDDTLSSLPVPAEYTNGRPEGVIASNVAGIYELVAQDIQDGTQNAPSFADALALHELLDRIETQN